MSPSDTVVTLTKVREMLTPEDAWIKGLWTAKWETIPDGTRSLVACDRGGTAECWCLDGALLETTRQSAVGAPLRESAYWHAADAIARVIGTSSIITWNDDEDRTHAEVLAALDKAISEEKRRADA